MYMHIIYSEQETSEIYLADIPSNTLVASWVSFSVPQLGATMLDDDEEFFVGVEAEATRVEGFFFFGPGFFLAAFGKPVVCFVGRAVPTKTGALYKCLKCGLFT